MGKGRRWVALARLGRMLTVMLAVVPVAASCRYRRDPRESTTAAPQARIDTGQSADEARTSVADEHRFAVVIGHNSRNGPRPPLRYAETDATRMASALRDVGGFAEADVHLLQAPAIGDVWDVLRTVALQVAAVRQGGAGRAFVLLYYSGHSDGKALELGSDGLPFADLRAWLTATEAEQRVVVVDACQSGAMVASKGGALGPDFPIGRGDDPTAGEVVLTSAAPSESALESGELHASFFSHFLVSGLRGAADSNHDGRVTVGEAYEYASSQTVAETAGTLFGAQHPGYELRLAGTGNLVLTHLSSSKSAFEFPPELDQVRVIDAVHGAVSAELTADSARRVVVVPGPYVVRARRGPSALTARLKVAPGETRRVELGEFAEEATAAAAAREPGEFPASSAPRTPEDAIAATRGDCSYRCLFDAKEHRSDCAGAVTTLTSAGRRSLLRIDLPSRRSQLRLKFEVCDPSGVWLNLGDSPSCNGAGGDDAQFSNDAELELRGKALWLFSNDYGRKQDGSVTVLGSAAGYVGSACVERSLVVGDGFLQSETPALRIRSEYALRLDPRRDDEGQSDRRWYLGINRSVGSEEPSRSGSGLSWVEICVR